MYLSDSWTERPLRAEIKPATNYERVSGVYADVPDPTNAWLALQSGANSISLRLTWEQLNALHAVLDALLHDHTRHVLGHNEPAEVIADLDPTKPGDTPAGLEASHPYIVNGNTVVFTATDDWRLCVMSVNGDVRGVSEYPAWDTYGEALAWLAKTLEMRPSNARIG